MRKRDATEPPFLPTSPPIAASTNGVPRTLEFNGDFNQSTSGWQLVGKAGWTSDDMIANDRESPDDVDVEHNLMYYAGFVGGGGLAGRVSETARVVPNEMYELPLQVAVLDGEAWRSRGTFGGDMNSMQFIDRDYVDTIV